MAAAMERERERVRHTHSALCSVSPPRSLHRRKGQTMGEWVGGWKCAWRSSVAAPGCPHHCLSTCLGVQWPAWPAAWVPPCLCAAWRATKARTMGEWRPRWKCAWRLSMRASRCLHHGLPGSPGIWASAWPAAWASACLCAWCRARKGPCLRPRTLVSVPLCLSQTRSGHAPRAAASPVLSASLSLCLSWSALAVGRGRSSLWVAGDGNGEAEGGTERDASRGTRVYP